MYTYGVYGLSLASNAPLPQLPPSPKGASHLTFTLAETRPRLDELSVPPWLYATDKDGSRFFSLYLLEQLYLMRWHRFFDFTVSNDGGNITCLPLPGVSEEVIHTYLLGRVLSLALRLRGRPNLHASAVATARGALGFLGRTGQGKSTLAAACLLQGCEFLTDDVLALEKVGGGYCALPGPGQARLAPDALEVLSYPDLALSLAQKSPAEDGKVRVWVGNRGLGTAVSVPLRALYVLAPAAPHTAEVSIAPLPAAVALRELLAHTYNLPYLHGEVLRRHFTFLGSLVQRVPLFRLAYPRDLRRLPQVCARVIDHSNHLPTLQQGVAQEAGG